MSIELELKLMIQPQHLPLVSNYLTSLVQTGGEEAGKQFQLMNAYFDTPQGVLRETGIALRIRAIDQRYIQTVKTRGSSRIGMHARGEWEWDIEQDSLDLSLLNSIPLPQALSQAGWREELQEVFRTDFSRRIWQVSNDKSKIEVVMDQGEVVSSHGLDEICELELELKEGSEQALYELALNIAERIPVQVGLVSKAQKGARLEHGRIEFPEKVPSHSDIKTLAAYWYEVWLVYWEAIFFTQDPVLTHPLKDALAQLKRCLPEMFQADLEKLGKVYQEHSVKHDITHFDFGKQAFFSELQNIPLTGQVMLKVGLWLNQQLMR
ncbi:CYTH domain-containing protein [Marinomonas epiphytica]